MLVLLYNMVACDLNFKFDSYKMKHKNHANIIYGACTTFTHFHCVMLFANSVNILVCIFNLSLWKLERIILLDAGILK